MRFVRRRRAERGAREPNPVSLAREGLIVFEGFLIILEHDCLGVAITLESGLGASHVAKIDLRSLRPLRTRNRLIAAARLIIAEHGGLESIPIEEIARQSGVATGSFYNHFASKQLLFEAAVAEAASEHAALLSGLLAGIEDSALSLATGARLTMRIVRDDPIWGALAVHTGIYVDELWRALGADLEQGVRRGTESGRFRVADLHTSVAAIAGASFGVMKSTLEGKLPDDADCLLAEQILHVLGLPTEEAHEIAFSPLPELAGATSNGDRPVASTRGVDAWSDSAETRGIDTGEWQHDE